jgi:hypothetical protein
MFTFFYPLAPLFSQLGPGPSGFDTVALPSATAVNRHLQPSTSAVWRDAGGIRVDSRKTLPAMGGVIVALASGYGNPQDLLDVSQVATPQNLAATRMKEISTAIGAYASAHQAAQPPTRQMRDGMSTLPPAAAGHKPGGPPVSWRVLLLPYMGQDALFQQYRLDEPWDSENNQKVLARMPECYKPVQGQPAGQFKTPYLAVVGEPYAMAADKPRPLAEIRDGSQSTILLVEVADGKAVPWTKPEDYVVDRKDPTAGLRRWPRVFQFAMADGTVRPLDLAIEPEMLKAMFTRSGSEQIPWETLGRYTDSDGRTMPLMCTPGPGVAGPGVASPAEPVDGSLMPAGSITPAASGDGLTPYPSWDPIAPPPPRPSVAPR